MNFPLHLSIISIAVVLNLNYAHADGAICYSSKNAFATNPPKGWIADFEGAKRLNLCVVYILKGTTFDSSPALIYPNLVENNKKLPSGKADLSDFIEGDIEAYKKRSPKGRVVDAKPIQRQSRSIPVKDFLNGTAPNEFERIGFLSEGSDVLVIALSARNEKDFNQYQTSLNEFIRNIESFPKASLFSYLKNKAVADKKSKDGKAFESSFIGSIGGQLATTMSKCSSETKDAKTSSLNSVLLIGSSGTIDEVVMEKESPLGLCFKPQLQNLKGSKPPVSPFHLFLEIEVKP